MDPVAPEEQALSAPADTGDVPPGPIDRAATVFKALGDPIRIRLIAAIRDGDGSTACFCDLASHFDMPQSSLSHHLRVLVTAGLLERERRGTWSWYTLRSEPLTLLQDAVQPGALLSPSELCATDPATDPATDAAADVDLDQSA